MGITCQHCGRDVPPENVNVQTSIAKCASCGAVFGFASQVPGATAAYAKRRVEMPKGYSLDMEAADLVITRRWFSWKYVALLFFCLFWDGFLVFWYAMAFTKGAPLVMKVFPVLHVAVGVFLTYTVAAGFLNRTKIRLNSMELSVKHYPLPWPGNRKLGRQELEQLFCEEKMNANRNGVSYSYALHAVLRGGSRIKLVSGLDSPEQALFLEQKIESHLGIADRPVAGEMRPV